MEVSLEERELSLIRRTPSADDLHTSRGPNSTSWGGVREEKRGFVTVALWVGGLHRGPTMHEAQKIVIIGYFGGSKKSRKGMDIAMWPA